MSGKGGEKMEWGEWPGLTSSHKASLCKEGASEIGLKHVHSTLSVFSVSSFSFDYFLGKKRYLNIR